MTVTVRPAAKSDVPAVAAVLADAFSDDPVMEWMWPDERHRVRGLKRMFATEATFHLLPADGVDIAESAAGVVGGATLWAPPGAWKPSTLTTMRMMPGMIAALGRRARVGAVVSEALEAGHPAEPHWYLSAIGTSTAARGGGYGSALLRSRLDHCDEARVPAYLESSKESNIGYYERFGFAVTGEIVIPDGGPTLWAMWRTPR
ncbi:MAG: GNAT family N-acetyltransferase [Rhodococcus sp. (in: high G+C Gram-positive bacteria)]|uniref:GNAT family N-acetyltransferase n=1 Tax=Rhodococcus sp. TaxID=1831 RepID=UPI003BB68AA0